MLDFANPAEDAQREKCFQKLTWATKEEALAAIAYARWQHGDSGELKPYQCRYCGKWHLSRA